MFDVVGIVVVWTDEVLYVTDKVSQWFHAGYHVERHWKRVADVNVIHPQTSPCKFPLHVTVTLPQYNYFKLSYTLSTGTQANHIGEEVREFFWRGEGQKHIFETAAYVITHRPAVIKW